MTDKTNRIARKLQVIIRRTKGNSAETLGELVAPAVSFGIDRLRGRLPVEVGRILAPSAWSSLRDHLTSRLIFALGPTARLQQNVAKAVTRSLGDWNGRRNDGITLDELARHFPETTETAANLIALWIDAQCELLRRLYRDKSVLRKHFLAKRTRFRVTALRPGLSDPHDRGRTVTLVGFSGNRRIVYKPRSCRGEQIWFCAVRWLNQNGSPHSFQVPKLLARQNYGWMQHVRSRGCTSSARVHEFYFRWGEQTALAQILGASDLHRENWLAVGSQPILVDAESIENEHGESLSALLETGLLPLTRRDGAGSYKGIAPFDAEAFQRPPLNCWPRLRRTYHPPAQYAIDLVRGFERVSRLLANPQRARQFFDKVISPTNRRQIGRIFFRSTAEYARLLRESLEPVMMILPGRRRRWLVRECRGTAANRAIADAEARALLRCDIPKFTARGRTVSCLRFSNTIAELKSGAQVLRQRVLWNAH